MRLVDIAHDDGQSHFSVLFRDREGKATHAIDKLELPMPGPPQRAQRDGGDRGGA